MNATDPTVPVSHLFTVVSIVSLTLTDPQADFGLLGHARIGDTTWSVHNGDPKQLLNMPAPKDAPGPLPTAVKGNNYWSPTYVSPATPYIMFIPACFPWYGCFELLHFKRAAIPIEQIELGEDDEGLWRLAPYLGDRWHSFELYLRRVLFAMMEVAILPRPAGTVTFGYPYRQGYLGNFRTENAARTVASRAIHAFLPLMGNIAMLFWYLKMGANDMSDWRDRVCQKAGIHHQLLADLENSAAGDLTLPRIGGLLDFSGPANGYTELFDPPRNLDFLLGRIISTRLPVPLYISWGPVTGHPSVFVPHTFRDLQFFPDAAEVKYLKDLPGRVAFSRWAMTTNAKTLVLSSCRDSDPYVPPATSGAARPLDPPRGPFPPVEPCSGQRPGEHMHEFFARRKKKNADTLAHKSTADTTRRLQLEDHAAKGAVPGRKGARVFVWERSNGHYIRRAAGRQNYEDVWEEYGPLQRRYDSFYNEWDACEDFGPDGGNDDGDGDDEGHVSVACEPAFTVAPSLPEGDEDDADAPSEMLPEIDQALEEGELPPLVPPQMSSFTSSLELPHYTQIAPDIQNMVYLRFGCTAAKEAVKVSPNLDLPLSAVAKKFLGDEELAVSNSHQGRFDNFRAFLAYCHKSRSLSDIPKPLLDYHDNSSEIFSAWTIQVRRETLNGDLYYVVHEHKNPSPSRLFILLQSAVNTLEIVRQGWGPSLRDVMEQLLLRGITFYVCFRSDEIPTGKPGPRNTFSGLGYRPESYEPDVLDYQAYVTLRTQFFVSPRGRAALLHGGLIGRLAREVVSHEEVLRGPTDDATIDGICLWDKHSQLAYWDDCLSEQEIDLICGVYHVSTGM